jgi:hypothetical protein
MLSVMGDIYAAEFLTVRLAIVCSVADLDPRSGGCLTSDPGSGMGKNQDPGSGMNISDYISQSLVPIFWVKNT